MFSPMARATSVAYPIIYEVQWTLLPEYMKSIEQRGILNFVL